MAMYPSQKVGGGTSGSITTTTKWSDLASDIVSNVDFSKVAENTKLVINKNRSNGDVYKEYYSIDILNPVSQKAFRLTTIISESNGCIIKVFDVAASGRCSWITLTNNSITNTSKWNDAVLESYEVSGKWEIVY